jgi:hypothetical protein
MVGDFLANCSLDAAKIVIRKEVYVKLVQNISRRTLLAAGGLLFSSALAAGLATGCGQGASGTSVKAKASPKLTVSPSPVPYERKAKVTISGSGFAPNQELELQIPIGGVPSDISAMVKPTPKTNQQGSFSTHWILDNEIRGKLLEPTAYTLEVLNTDGKVLAKAPFVLEKVEAKKKK